MSRRVAIMLAGTLRPSPLRQALDIPVLCLPYGSAPTLLAAWRSALKRIRRLDEIRIVLNSEADLAVVERAAFSQIPRRDRPEMKLVAEPAAWRGAGGILRDVTADLGPDDIVIMAEAACAPPDEIARLVEALNDDLDGVVGVCEASQPAGVCVFRRSAFNDVPEVGYHDLKEQFLPAFHRAGGRVGAVSVDMPLRRLRDRAGYLAAIRSVLGTDDDERDVVVSGPEASVSGSAVLAGAVIVENGAVIEDGAIVHDTVVLAGATIGGGAVVSDSVIGPLAAVRPRSRVVRELVGRSTTTRQDATGSGTRGSVRGGRR